MTKRVSFVLFDNAGFITQVLDPEVVLYVKSTGEPLPAPAVENKGTGFYEFMTDPEQDGPTAYLVDAGPGASPQFLVGSVGEFIAFAMYDQAGQPDGSLVPSFSNYTDADGLNLTPPEIVDLTGGLFGFWPQVEPGQMVRYIVGDFHNVWSGTVGSTAVTSSDPPEGSEIPVTQVLSVDVADTETELGRVLIAVKYPEWGGATELAWDGQSVCGPFQVTVTPIPGGRRYTILRLGGWPSSPVLRIFVTNYGGREL